MTIMTTRNQTDANGLCPRCGSSEGTLHASGWECDRCGTEVPYVTYDYYLDLESDEEVA